MSKKRYRRRDHQTHFGMDIDICRHCQKLVRNPVYYNDLPMHESCALEVIYLDPKNKDTEWEIYNG